MATRSKIGVRLLLVAMSVAIAPVMAAEVALADETGLAQALHDTRREGGRLCLSDHFHDGNSSGARSRNLAEKAAVVAWAEFTNFEYGSSWASWRNARSKTMSCESGASGWSCHASARPCR